MKNGGFFCRSEDILVPLNFSSTCTHIEWTFIIRGWVPEILFEEFLSAFLDIWVIMAFLCDTNFANWIQWASIDSYCWDM